MGATYQEVLEIRSLVDGECETHDWMIAQMQTELVPRLRARHGKGGVNVCVECVERWKRWADEQRAKGGRP